MKRVLIIGVCVSLISCGVGDKRIQLIKGKSGLELPPKYEVTRNESIDGGSIDGDFSVYIDLKFDEENFNSLQSNIKTDLAFGHWTHNEFGQRFISNDEEEPTTIEIDKENRTLKFVMHHI